MRGATHAGMQGLLWVSFGCCYQICRATFGEQLRDFAADFAKVNFNIFTKESILVASAFAPVYAVARSGDEPIHHGLYDEWCHKNTFGFGCWRKSVTEDWVAVPLLGLGVGLLATGDENLIIGRVFLAGLLSGELAKDVIKECVDHEIGYRPLNGDFKKKVVCGGFPSGHMTAVAFATIYLGLTKGASWAIPVGMYAGFVAGMLIVCNYHYASQVVAGTGLGALYAVAAYKVACERLNDHWEFNAGMTAQGKPGLSVSYSF